MKMKSGIIDYVGRDPQAKVGSGQIIGASPRMGEIY